jgi:hypothetical protein
MSDQRPVKNSARPSWKMGSKSALLAAGAVAVFAILMLSAGTAAAGSSTGAWGAWGTPSPPSFSVLATLPLANTVVANSTMVFAAGVTNCSQIWGINATGFAGVYATVPVYGSACHEGALILAPYSIPATCISCNVSAGPRGGTGGWGHNCGNSKQETLYYVEDGYLFEITSGGSVVSIVTTFSVPSAKTESMGLAYDQVGMFNHDLIVTGSSGGEIWLVNQTGVVTDFASLHTYIAGPAVAPWGFGPYGGDLMVAAKTLGLVEALNSTGSVTVVTNWTKAIGVAFQTGSGGGGCGGWGGGCSFGSAHDIFFLANYSSGAIEAFPASDFRGIAGQGIVAGGENYGIASFSWSGATSLFASGTERLGNIAFISCFGGQGNGWGSHWTPGAGHAGEQ